MPLRSSETIGAIAAALARAQVELANPEKSLTATILPANPRESARQFRYAPLSAGLDLVRKALGKQEIAALQATAIDLSAGVIRLDTVIAHSSGEWLSSEWPVCALSEASAPRRMGAALTYARRYALFALVGIAGEDDLDAPDLDLKVEPTKPTPGNGSAGPDGARPPFHGPPNGRNKDGQPIFVAPALPALQAAALREKLIGEIDRLRTNDEAAAWAATGLPAKAALPPKDAQAVEARFRQWLSEREARPPAGDAESPGATTESAATAAEARTAPQESNGSPTETAEAAAPPTEAPPPNGRAPVVRPIRLRDKEHLRFVAAQPCLLCGRSPADPHHLRYVQPRALGRKVSDEFAAPLCRGHHRELHRAGDERRWWRERNLDPEPIALDLWRRSHGERGPGEPPGPAAVPIDPPPTDPPPTEPPP